MSLSSTIDLLATEAIIFGLVWVFYSAGSPVFAGILFVALHLIAHNGHVGVRDNEEVLRRWHGHLDDPNRRGNDP